MYKLLVNDPNEGQKIEKVNISGSYFDSSLVLWDERTDGDFPQELEEKVGILIRVNNKLEVDTSKETWLAEEKDRKAKEDALKQIYEARKAEYPSATEVIHAILDNHLDEIQAKRQQVKQKYPLPPTE